MNTWQCLRQLQYLHRQRRWTGSSTSVWASKSVIISAAPHEEIVERVTMPVAVIRPGSCSVDRYRPDLLDQEVVITLGVSHAGDAYGEFPVVGGHRTSQTESKGRGLLEVEEEMFAAAELLNADDGIEIQFRGASATQPKLVSGQYLLLRDYLFRLDVTTDRYYHPVINLQES